MFEVVEYVLESVTCEGYTYWVSGEFSNFCDNSSIHTVRLDVSDVRYMVDEGICLLFARE